MTRTQAAPTNNTAASPPNEGMVKVNGVTFGPVLADGPTAGYRVSSKKNGRQLALSPTGEIREVRQPPRTQAPRRPRTPSRTEEQAIQLVLAQPESYRLYDKATERRLEELSRIAPSERGTPEQYPDALLSAVASIRHALGTHLQPVHDKVLSAPGLVEQMWDGVVTHGPYPLTPAQRAARASKRFPDRAALGRMIKDRFTSEEQQDALTRMGVAAALEIGYWTGGDHDLEALRNHVHCDGTVLRSPSRAGTATAIDPKTGRVFTQRLDTARGNYHEGGTKDTVTGSKYTFVGVAAHGQSGGFSLGVGHVAGSAPVTEFAATMALWDRIHNVLDELDPDRKRRPVSIVVDGAPSGSQIGAMVTDYDLLVSCPPKRRQAPTDTKPEILKTVQLPEQACTHCGVIENLTLDGSTLLRWEPVNNRQASSRVPFKIKKTVAKKRAYWYLRYDCRCGSEVLLPFRPMDGESPTQYNRRMDVMRGWERDSTQMKSIYQSHRGKVENTNKQRDDRYHFKRVPAYGVRSQTALLAQEEFGKIMLALADHRAAQTPQSRGRPRRNN